jgi:hypothetical protein
LVREWNRLENVGRLAAALYIECHLICVRVVAIVAVVVEVIAYRVRRMYVLLLKLFCKKQYIKITAGTLIQFQ